MFTFIFLIHFFKIDFNNFIDMLSMLVTKIYVMSLCIVNNCSYFPVSWDLMQLIAREI